MAEEIGSEYVLSTGNNHSRSSTTPSRRFTCPKIRRVGSKGAVLVLVWTYLSYFSVSGPVFNRYNYELHYQWNDYKPNIISFGMFVILGPLAGLVTSVYYRRYKALYASFLLMWSGMLVIVTVLVVVNLLVGDETWPGYIVTVGEVVYFTGFTVFAVNSVPFGLDQMPDASQDQICVFIHWYIWAVIAGNFSASLPHILHDCYHIPYRYLSGSVLGVAFITIILCTLFLLRPWLIIEPVGTNPIKNMYKIIKFAAKHKVPVRRSAFTYCEPGRPSRLDNAKTKYGGPFTNEQVEDVKTCLRMLLVLLSLTVPLTFVSFGVQLSNKLRTRNESLCQEHTVKQSVELAITLCLLVPVYDVVIRPMFRKRTISSMKKIGFSLVLSILSDIIPLVLLTVWYHFESPQQCLLSTHEYYGVRYVWIHGIIYFFDIVPTLFAFKALLEFVCAQSPYNLRGLLHGTVFSVLLLSIAIGYAVYTVWVFGYSAPDHPDCVIWFSVFASAGAILGCVLWCAVAKWYKKRERDEPDMYRVYIENIFDRRINRRDQRSE